MELTQQTATLIAAIVAASAALTNAVFTARRQSRLEQEKWSRARDDEKARWEQGRQDRADEALRLALADVARQIAVAAQAISWLTWKAAHEPSQLTAADVAAYNEDIKAVMPNIVAAHLLVVALDRSTDGIIKPIVRDLYRLDQTVALAAAKIAISPQECLAQLRELFQQSDSFLVELHDQFSSMLWRARVHVP